MTQAAFTDQDIKLMRQALTLAERGLWSTAPNPRVGCVIAQNGQVVGEGWHARAGEAHAEVVAIADAKRHLQLPADTHKPLAGCVAYVTLEPCCHTGRTGPCTEALIASGVSHVIAASVDPNPKVSGQGLEALEAAGITTTAGLLEPEAEQLNIGFYTRMRHGRPYTRVKIAASLDGKIAMASGESKWITGEAARQDVHRLRARSDAILTGIGTVKADNPRLTARPHNGAEGLQEPPQPLLRVVLDHSAELFHDPELTGCHLLTDAAPTRIYIANDLGQPAGLIPQSILDSENKRCQLLPTKNRHFSWQDIMRDLAAQEVNELLVEAGSATTGSALDSGLVDEVIYYMAPKIMGESALSFAHALDFTKLSHAVSLKLIDTTILGDDLKLRFYLPKD